MSGMYPMIRRAADVDSSHGTRLDEHDGAAGRSRVQGMMTDLDPVHGRQSATALGVGSGVCHEPSAETGDRDNQWASETASPVRPVACGAGRSQHQFPTDDSGKQEVGTRGQRDKWRDGDETEERGAVAPPPPASASCLLSPVRMTL